MKLLIFLLTGFLTIQQPSPQWQNNLEQAKTEAHAAHKRILLNFSGSDWCGPCIKLTREVFGSESFKTYAGQNLVLLNADFPRQKKHKLSKELTARNEALAEQYNKAGTFPLTLLLDENGKVLKKWEGNPGLKPEQFIAALKTN